MSTTKNDFYMKKCDAIYNKNRKHNHESKLGVKLTDSH